jgi:hypothetical protein
MKIGQDLKSGQINIQLKQGEEYDIEEHLHALTDFLAEQALELCKLNNRYNELAKRLSNLETVSAQEK